MALVGLVVGLAAAASGCGGGGSAATASTIVKPPDVQLSGCSYETDGQLPPQYAQGIQPRFPSFTPDQAAVAALQDIRRHGGTGIVNGFTIPFGAKLYAGPDSSSTPVVTLEQPNSMLFEDPLYWTTSNGQKWLASFVACGGPNLYWVSVDQVTSVNPSAGGELSFNIKAAIGNPPFTKTGEVSTLPVRIKGGTIVWATTAKVGFPVGRGEFLSY